MNSQAPQKVSDYEFEPVPQSQRRSLTDLTMVWIGFVLTVTMMLAGGGLASGMRFSELFWVCILGNLFLCGIACTISVIAVRTGLSFALLSRYSFGTLGSKIPSVFVAVVNVGWFTITAGFYGYFVATLLGLGEMGTNIALMLSTLAMGGIAVFGVRALSILGHVSIPAIILLIGALLARVVSQGGGMEALFSYAPKESMSLVHGMTLVIGTWIFAASTSIPDIMRFGRSEKDVIISTLIGLVVGNSIIIVSGAVLVIMTGAPDIVQVLVSAGLVVPGIILLTTNLFTTSAANLYAVGLNLSNSLNMKREKVTVLVLAAATLVSLLRPHEIGPLFAFLNFLGVAVPPLASVILVEYFVNRNRFRSFTAESMPTHRMAPWIAWIGAIALAMLIPMGLPSLNGMIAGGVIYLILQRFSAQPVVSAASTTVTPAAPASADVDATLPTAKDVNPKALRVTLGGIVLMAVGAFMACLAADTVWGSIGNILLLVSLGIGVYGYLLNNRHREKQGQAGATA